ncbi:hypothetical protein FKO01_05630 [Mesorhizobium sp. B2-3-3]|nr:hypothetical protein FKO01_05630 [Mesorhizobium sp. B2-3-3]
MPVSQSEIKAGIHSRLTVGNFSLLVGNTHQEVHDAISAAGGNVQPIPTDGANLKLDTATVGDLKSHIEAQYNLPRGMVRIVNSEGKDTYDKDIVAQLLKGHGNREKR